MAPDRPPKAASPTRSPASAADDMHETAITAAATIFLMFMLVAPTWTVNGRSSTIPTLPKIVYLCPYRRHHDPTRTIADAQALGQQCPYRPLLRQRLREFAGADGSKADLNTSKSQ